MRWPWDRRGESPSDDRRQEVLILISKRLKECDDALRANPQDVDALFTRGVFLARIGEYWRSIECLELVTELNPAYPGVWHLKSSLYLRVGDHGNARACRERAQVEW
jgi:tetratricopeptide (TPR) repeat protein